MNKVWYIYKIINLLDGKAYVGQKLRKDSNPLSDGYMGSGKYLKHATKKYNLNNFKKEILIDGLTSQFAASLFEEYFIKKEETLFPNGYNLTNGAVGGNTRQGAKLSKETKKKIGLANKRKSLGNTNRRGKKCSEKTKLKQSISHKNMTQETRSKMSAAKQNMSKETKEKMSEAKKGNKNMLGKNHSEESKQKMSESHKGHKRSIETQRKMNETRKGIKYNKKNILKCH
jgi:hypothetical protein